MSIRDDLLHDIVVAAGGTVRNPNNRNMLLEDWLAAAGASDGIAFSSVETNGANNGLGVDITVIATGTVSADMGNGDIIPVDSFESYNYSTYGTKTITLTLGADVIVHEVELVNSLVQVYNITDGNTPNGVASPIPTTTSSVKITFANALLNEFENVISGGVYRFSVLGTGATNWNLNGGQSRVDGVISPKATLVSYTGETDIERTLSYDKSRVDFLLGSGAANSGFKADIIKIEIGAVITEVYDTIYDFNNATFSGGTITVPNSGTSGEASLVFTALEAGLKLITPQPYVAPPAPLPTPVISSAVDNAGTVTVTGTDFTNIDVDHAIIYDTMEESVDDLESWDKTGDISYSTEQAFFGTKSFRGVTTLLAGSKSTMLAAASLKESFVSYRVFKDVGTGVLSRNVKLPRLVGGQLHTDYPNLGCQAFDIQDNGNTLSTGGVSSTGGVWLDGGWMRVDMHGQLPATEVGTLQTEVITGATTKNFNTPVSLDVGQQNYTGIYGHQFVATDDGLGGSIDVYKIYLDAFCWFKNKCRVEWTQVNTYDKDLAIACKPLTGDGTSMDIIIPPMLTGGYLWYFNTQGTISNSVAQPA